MDIERVIGRALVMIHDVPPAKLLERSEKSDILGFELSRIGFVHSHSREN